MQKNNYECVQKRKWLLNTHNCMRKWDGAAQSMTSQRPSQNYTETATAMHPLQFSHQSHLNVFLTLFFNAFHPIPKKIHDQCICKAHLHSLNRNPHPLFFSVTFCPADVTEDFFPGVSPTKRTIAFCAGWAFLWWCEPTA